jgi:plastocyanin
LKFRPVIFSLCIAVAVTGCSKKDSGDSPEPPAPTASVDLASAAQITGTVKLEGSPPVFKAIDMSAEAVCVQSNPAPVVPPIIVTGPHGALANAVVYVKSGLGSYRFETPSTPVVLDQKGCMYSPRVLAIMVNQPFEVNNQDQTIHNVHAMSRANKSWNKSEPVGDPPIQATFTKPELAIPIACNIHPWMRAFLFVFAHPYFDITTKSGEFAIKNLPPGTYIVEAWQERFGYQDQTITVSAKETKSISFTFTSGPPK